MWIYANPNPCRKEEPDCVIRAVSIATDQSWKRTHSDLCTLSRDKCTMPSVNWLWGLYLLRHGFRKFLLPDNCPQCMTVRDFCRMYPEGTYVLGTGTHAVAAVNGNWYDIWDSGDETITIFYERSE